MIYLPVQFYALYPVLSGIILSFRAKCLIMPHATQAITDDMLVSKSTSIVLSQIFSEGKIACILNKAFTILHIL